MAKIQISITPEQGQLLVQILGECTDDYCDDRPEYQRSSVPDDYDEELRNKTYDDYGNLLKAISEQVDVESNP